MIREIAPNATYFTTVNEPMVHLGGAYVVGLTPPQKKGFEHLRAPLLGLLRAHVAAYRTLHEEAASRGRPVKVGMAHHLRIFDPKRAWNPIDRIVAREMDQAFNWTIPTALETGRVRMKIPGLVRIDEVIDGLAGTQDSVELNYYTRDLMTLGWRNGTIEPTPSVRPGSETNDLGWEIYPEGFLRILRETQKRFPGKSIIITENGIADADDSKRARFIRDHISALSQAIGEGIPVEGYFHWSFLDNFEWIEGFDPRFGLVEIDYATLERKPRPSFLEYARLIREKTGN